MTDSEEGTDSDSQKYDGTADSNAGNSENETKTHSRKIPDHARVLGTAMDMSDVGIVLVAPDGTIEWINEAVETYFGLTRERIIGNDRAAVVREEIKPVLEQPAEFLDAVGATEPGETDGYECHVVPDDSHDDRWLLYQSQPIEQGELAGGYVEHYTDITERKEREQELREEQAFTESLINALPEVFYAFDSELNFYRWNDRLCEVTGYTDEEIATMSPLDFFPESEEESVEEAMNKILVNESPTRIESTYLTKDGEEIPYELSGGPLYDADGNLNGFAGIGRDITERKERERELERSNERLEQFAYIVSHDLQEPLRTMSNYIELLESEYAEEIDDEADHYIDTVVTSSERMQSMLNGLLDYSRVTTRGEEFEPVDVEQVVSETVDGLQVMIDEHDGTVQYDDLPIVHGDTAQLARVFQNLIKNALEHSEDEPVTIDIAGFEEDDRYRFVVEDDGPGIEPGRGEDIFGIFNSSKRDQTSAEVKGLGLAICDNIIRRHGGQIEVHSEHGEGARFEFTIEKQDS